MEDHMAWNDTARDHPNRGALRYPSDLTDREGALIAPMLPAAKRGGRPRTTDPRAVIDAIQDIACSGCQWRMLPKDFPPVLTVRGLLLRLARRRALVCDQPPAGRRQSGTGRPKGQPSGGRYRQPIGENDRSWRSLRIRCREKD